MKHTLTLFTCILLWQSALVQAEQNTAPEAAASDGIVSWPAPGSEALYEDYALRVDGRAVPVYSCRVSAIPFNQIWPGYQRPIDQTELAGFAVWDMPGPVKVKVVSRRAVQSVVVRPASRGIRPAIDGDRITLTLERPGPLVVEVNGILQFNGRLIGNAKEAGLNIGPHVGPVQFPHPASQP